MKDKIKILNKEYGNLLPFLIFFNIMLFLGLFIEYNFKEAIIVFIFEISYLIILSLILTSQKILKYFNDKSDIFKYFKRQEIKNDIFAISFFITIIIFFVVSSSINLGLTGFIMSSLIIIFLLIIYILSKIIHKIKKEKELQEKLEHNRQYIQENKKKK